MAPQAGEKRAAAVAAPAAKKCKRDPMLKGITEAISLAELPEDVKSMLSFLIEHSIEVPEDARHELQAKSVEMVSDTITATATKMQRELQEQEGVVEHADRVKGESKDVVAQAKTKAQAAEAQMQTKKVIAADAFKSMIQTRDICQSTREAEEKGQETCNAINAEREEFEAVMAKNLEMIKVGAFENTSAKFVYDELAPFLKKLDLDNSLSQALPSVCQKNVADRTPFDGLVLGELETRLKKRVDQLTSSATAEAPGVAQRREAVVTAQAELHKLQGQQQGSAQQLQEALQVEKDAVEALQAAEQLENSHQLEYEKSLTTKDEKKEALENFQNYNVACFEMLKAKANMKPSEDDMNMAAASADA